MGETSEGARRSAGNRGLLGSLAEHATYSSIYRMLMTGNPVSGGFRASHGSRRRLLGAGASKVSLLRRGGVMVGNAKRSHANAKSPGGKANQEVLASGSLRLGVSV